MLFISCCGAGFAQHSQNTPARNQLKLELLRAKEDTARVAIMIDLCNSYINKRSDSAVIFGEKALALARQINYPLGEAESLNKLGIAVETRGDLPKALNLQYQAMQIAQENHYPLQYVRSLVVMGGIFWDLRDFPRAISTYKAASAALRLIGHQAGRDNVSYEIQTGIGQTYSENNQLDSAAFYLQNAYKVTLNSTEWHPVALMFLGDLQAKLGKKQLAISYLHQSIQIFKRIGVTYSYADACGFIAKLFSQTNQPDSCIYFAKEALVSAQSIGYKTAALTASKLLAEEYEQKNINQAYPYLKLQLAITDELYGSKKVQELQKIIADEQERQVKIDAGRIARENRLKQFAFMAGISILLLIAFILVQNNRQKQAANKILEHTLSHLKSTQNQLIQREKMASLGDLTAGVAHEIQNPLNFVNNFSDVNREMLEELKAESEKPKADRNGKLEIELINDLIDNEEKINHHGKRADAIVKSMLEHSKMGTGERQFVDLNMLAAEFLKLSYNSTLAKDKNFTAAMVTHFDKTLPKIEVVQQDIGRVLLNLFNNAFYAVNEKRKTAEADYKPEVAITTTLQPPPVGGGAEIICINVKDNGNGIPEAIKDKIMQPFFTTKPTGEGTGLGLSLSYDIVVKGHGGTIELKTAENIGAEFIVILPIS
jgi:two-component system NtrC family sensor kinase